MRGEDGLNCVAYEKNRECLCFVGVCVSMYVGLSVSLREEKMFSTVLHTTKVVIVSELLVCVSVCVCMSVCLCLCARRTCSHCIAHEKVRDRLWVIGVCFCLCIFVCLSVSLREEIMFSTVSHTKKIVIVSLLLVCVCGCVVCLSVYVFAQGEDVLNGIAYHKDRDRLCVCVCLCMFVYLSVSPREENMFSTVSYTTKIVIISRSFGLCVCMYFCLCVSFNRNTRTHICMFVCL